MLWICNENFEKKGIYVVFMQLHLTKIVPMLRSEFFFDRILRKWPTIVRVDSSQNFPFLGFPPKKFPNEYKQLSCKLRNFFEALNPKETFFGNFTSQR